MLPAALTKLGRPPNLTLLKMMEPVETEKKSRALNPVS
jgi:hypothetical protein